MKSVLEAIEAGRKIRSENRAQNAIFTYEKWQEYRYQGKKRTWVIGVKCQWPGRLGDGLSVLWPLGADFDWPDLSPQDAEWFAKAGKIRLETIKPEPWSTWPQLMKERRQKLWELLEECGLVEPEKCEHTALRIKSASQIKETGMILVHAFCHDCKEEIETKANPGDWIIREI